MIQLIIKIADFLKNVTILCMSLKPNKIVHFLQMLFSFDRIANLDWIEFHLSQISLSQ